ncbi:hypothetical protein Theco_2673 [Thermobacillus composti KWC4]|uniref:Uncharacterized protein n=2 Tax=Thermobacillus TaxID=76632 RepID=L0EEQ8_THECK|nr:hypothetical protein Theco_2673 [Thermobacillus composti KWC4]
MRNEQPSGRNLYIFNVELLIESDTNATALEHLVSALNRSGFTDYRIKSGIETGSPIQQAAQGPHQSNPLPTPAELANGKTVAAESVFRLAEASEPLVPSTGNSRETASGNAKGAADDGDSTGCIDKAMERIRGYIAGNRLVRLNVNRGRGIKLSVPCRIINLDESMYTVTVYHVDEKKVYTFGLFEIDDFIET